MRFLFFVLLFYLAYRLAKNLLFGHRNSLPREKTRQGEDMVRDPQCGLYLPRVDAMERKIGGEVHFFCSEKCRDAFAARH